MSKLQLYVKGITGNTITISCLNDIKIRDLKDLISNEIGKSVYMIRLLFKNRELEDEDFLNEIGIENETTFYYMIKLNEEVETLMEIKRQWNLDNNWSRDLHLSEWDDIEIHEDSEEKFIVKKIDLYNNELTGEIPKEIGNLRNLQYLYLHNNQLTGEIPKEIGNLMNLQDLYLSNNKLTGEIPKEIGNLRNLQVLSLYNNQLTGEIPKEIGNLMNLKYLSLWCNELTGEIPKEVKDLKCHKKI